jgi:hypothetical protein
MLGLFAATALAFASQPAPAAAPTYVCAEVQADLAKDLELTRLAALAYGPLQYRAWGAQAPCAVPTAALTYKAQTVLISAAEPPYQAHACQATLTAHVFARRGKDFKLVRTIPNFVQTGENCLPGKFTATSIAGKDGFVVEGAGGGQGAKAGWLEFYQVEAKSIRQIKLPGLTCTSVDYTNAGPAAADMQNIASSWRIGGGNNARLFLDFYVAKSGAKGSVLKTEWAFGRNGLTRVRGRTPEAFADGACL